METTAFFEKKLSITPKELNKVKNQSIDDILLAKAKDALEKKCSEQGFVLPGSITLISKSMGYFEPARFTGDVVYYTKLRGQIVYPADGVKVVGEVIRKNKMGLYVIHRDAIRIQVPRDLHLGSEDYEAVQIGDKIEVEIKRSKFQINDTFILASGIFIKNTSETIIPVTQPLPSASNKKEVEVEEEQGEEEVEEEEGEE